MYVEHPVFKKPADENTPIWRYMSFTKFVSLVAKKAMFFTSIAALRRYDPFEATLPDKHSEYRIQVYKEALGDASGSLAKELVDRFWGTDQSFGNLMAPYTVVNCWHINKFESAAMWKLYLPGGEGVAIRSTFSKLSKCFIKRKDTPLLSDRKTIPIYIGEVSYIDQFEGFLPTDNLLNRVVRKDTTFSYEQELRAVSALWPPMFGATNGFDFEEGIQKPKLIQNLLANEGVYFPVDLDVLLETVVLAPNSPAWIVELTSSILKKYRVDVPLKCSRLIR